MENRANIPILRKIIFGIVVSILLLATIASIFLIVNHSAGFFVEGMMGFVCEIVFRVFFIILFFLVLLMSHFIKKKEHLQLFGGFVQFVTLLDLFMQ
ncbi:MAG: hypothetical protein ACLUJM_08625 [Finegoldia sp.]|uniref:hypothetical protein n=1 Tax=Finegoldia TaxID=150022 RepID=UPI001F5B597F|nr:hypothetical protein [Finegoldia magna]MDU2575039.1 hypothetical protein [Finegoldia magna]